MRYKPRRIPPVPTTITAEESRSLGELCGHMTLKEMREIEVHDPEYQRRPHGRDVPTKRPRRQK